MWTCRHCRTDTPKALVQTRGTAAEPFFLCPKCHAPNALVSIGAGTVEDPAHLEQPGRTPTLPASIARQLTQPQRDALRALAEGRVPTAGALTMEALIRRELVAGVDGLPRLTELGARVLDELA